MQRVTALNRFLDDLYVGDQAAVNDGIIPRWLVTSSDGFQREAFGIAVPHGARCLVAGIDLVRDAEGTYRVLEDNLRNPSGVSYVLENRAAMTRVLPARVRRPPRPPVDHYGPSLLGALRRVSPAGADPEPTVVVLTPGRLQLRLLRARLPRPPDGRRAGRGPRPRRRRPRRVDAHDPRPQARRRDLPAHRRRLPRPRRVPQRLDPRRARADERGPRRQRHHRQRGRQRRGRRQGRLRLRARAHPLLPRRASRSSPACPPTSCGTRTSGPTCSTASTSWW